MGSGFLTSPCDHSRIFSGLASEIRIALNDSGSLGFSKKLKMSRIGAFLLPCFYERIFLFQAWADGGASTALGKRCSHRLTLPRPGRRPGSGRARGARRSSRAPEAP